ncbi:MAG: hypothetical protein NTY01_22995 [Verrucomicrobia bacterium]|nr:hypothetical protein [Verrucomicrobiota bacterium]
MHTFSDMAKALNRSPVYLAGLQKRFELPVFEGAAYSEAYVAFLRAVIALRTFGIAEDALLRLWNFEKKLLHLLHVDSAGSPTWFLDSCGVTTHPKQRLLLTNHDLGVPVPSKELQLGLNFADTLPELFGGTEMGEDALRVLNEYITLHARIRSDLRAELPHVRAAAKRVARLP